MSDGADLSRLRRNLALLVIGLLTALLVVLGAGVYITMRSALLDPVREAVQERVAQDIPQLLDIKRGTPHPRSNLRLTQADEGVFSTLADAHLTVLRADRNPFNTALPDRENARRVLQTGASHFSQLEAAGHRYLFYTAPAVLGTRVVGVVQAGISMNEYRRSIESLLTVLLTIGIFGIVAAGGITLLVVQRAIRPVRASIERQRAFVADAAHELRTPLTVLRAAGELSLRDELEQSEAIEQMLSQGAHLAHLVDDLSTLARADSGVLTIEHRPVDLTALVEDVASDLAVVAEDRDMRLGLRAEPAITTRGDATRLRQLLIILLDNALKYTPSGGKVTVTVRHTGHRALVEVRDTGPGIPPEDLPHIFDRFYRASRARTRGEGTGLGLAIGRWIAEAHSGHLTAANAPDCGAIFTITLPLAHAA